MKSYNDSLNYAFGALNGSQIKMYLLADDEDGKDFEEFVENVNKGLKEKVINPQIVAMGKNVGKAIREQEPVPSIPGNGSKKGSGSWCETYLSA